MDEVRLIWENVSGDTEAHNRVKECFMNNHLECKETKNGLYITGNDEKNDFSYMWFCMMKLAKHVWFRKAVKSCIWQDDYESEDVIESTEELIANGEMDLYE